MIWEGTLITIEYCVVERHTVNSFLLSNLNAILLQIDLISGPCLHVFALQILASFILPNVHTLPGPEEGSNQISLADRLGFGLAWSAMAGQY
eukprot:1160174-Pelagomonas_calceolata.AAC.2